MSHNTYDLAGEPGQCVDLGTKLSHEINQPWETGECELSTCIQFSDNDVRILDER